MKLLTYLSDGQEMLGVLSPDGENIYPLEKLGFFFENMEQLIRQITDGQLKDLSDKAAAESLEGSIAYKDAEILAPIPSPSEHVIVCDENYVDNLYEISRFRGEEFKGKRDTSYFYFKRAFPAVGPDAEIPVYEDLGSSVDYGVELAVILRKDARNVPKDKVEEYVFGYTILNNLCMREYLAARKQPYYGRSFDKFCALGPVIATKDEFDKFTPVTHLYTNVNKERVQDSSTWLMSADIADMVHTLSQSMTLKAGTIIATGTPSGTAVASDPPRYLKAGDVIECGIEGIGVLRNKMV